MLQLILNIISTILAGIAAWCVATALRQARRIEQVSLATNLKLDALDRSSGELSLAANEALYRVRSAIEALIARQAAIDSTLKELQQALEKLKKEDLENDQKLGI